MKKKYVAPKSEYIRFDVEDVITNVLPLQNYSSGDIETGGELSGSQGEGPGYGADDLD